MQQIHKYYRGIFYVNIFTSFNSIQFIDHFYSPHIIYQYQQTIKNTELKRQVSIERVTERKSNIMKE